MDMEITKRSEQVYEYRTDEIIVTWEPMTCEHSRECVTNLPEVFNSRARPWIKLTKAEASEVARVISLCPSRALKYEWPTGATSESDEALETNAPSDTTS